MPQFLGTNPVGWILTALVLLLLFVDGAILKKPLVLLITGTRTTGAVVGWRSDSTVKAPMVEFVALNGARVRVTGRVSTATHAVREGDQVTVFYRAADPEYAQLFLWNEFLSAAVFLGITAFLVVFWMAAIMVADDPGFGDPLRLVSQLAAQMRLNPVRFPQYLVLGCVIPCCAIGATSLFRSASEMRAHGIRVTGHVTEFGSASSRSGIGGYIPGSFPLVTYNDSTGATHTIRRSAAWPLTRLHIGDDVDILYLAGRPERGIVNTWDELYLVPLSLSVFMVGFVSVFVIVLRSSRG